MSRILKAYETRFRWLDEFFVCGRCGKLLWHGAHWVRIQHELERAAKE